MENENDERLKIVVYADGRVCVYENGSLVGNCIKIELHADTLEFTRVWYKITKDEIFCRSEIENSLTFKNGEDEDEDEDDTFRFKFNKDEEED